MNALGPFWVFTFLKLSSSGTIKVAAFRGGISSFDFTQYLYCGLGRTPTPSLLQRSSCTTAARPRTEKRFLSILLVGTMEAQDSNNTTTSNGDYTTDAVDQEEAARLKDYLANDASRTRHGRKEIQKDSNIAFVSIDEGRHKYVLIKATIGNDDDQQQAQEESRIFVVSQRGAHYHRNVAEWYIPKLHNQGFSNIKIQGGGRIIRDDVNKLIKVFGYSYGFGQADHEVATRVIRSDRRFQSYHVSWSNDGY
jgi:phosphohistidine phosphatase